MKLPKEKPGEWPYGWWLEDPEEAKRFEEAAKWSVEIGLPSPSQNATQVSASHPVPGTYDRLKWVPHWFWQWCAPFLGLSAFLLLLAKVMGLI